MRWSQAASNCHLNLMTKLRSDGAELVCTIRPPADERGSDDSLPTWLQSSVISSSSSSSDDDVGLGSGGEINFEDLLSDDSPGPTAPVSIEEPIPWAQEISQWVAASIAKDRALTGSPLTAEAADKLPAPPPLGLPLNPVESIPDRSRSGSASSDINKGDYLIDRDGCDFAVSDIPPNNISADTRGSPALGAVASTPDRTQPSSLTGAVQGTGGLFSRPKRGVPLRLVSTHDLSPTPTKLLEPPRSFSAIHAAIGGRPRGEATRAQVRVVWQPTLSVTAGSSLTLCLARHLCR